MLNKLFSILNSSEQKPGARFLDESEQVAAPQQTVAKTRATAPQASAIQALERKYGQITEQEIAATSEFLNKKEFRFYDFLLGDSGAPREVNTLEKKILTDTNKMLNRPEVMVKHLPQLPQSISQLKGMLDTQDFKLNEFSTIVQREPALASHMVNIANSPLHNQSGKEISDLNHAFMLIGSEGVKEHVLMRFFKQLLNIRPIYFKMFGAKIWDHSASTAAIAKQLASDFSCDKETAYLNGLVHDIGKIMIFQLMVNAFRSARPEDSPNSLVFKKLLNDKSMLISLLVVKEWQMPDAIVTAIHDLALTSKRPAKTKMGRILYEANLVSELIMMHSQKKLSPEQYLEISKQEKLSEFAIKYLFENTVAEDN